MFYLDRSDRMLRLVEMRYRN